MAARTAGIDGDVTVTLCIMYHSTTYCESVSRFGADKNLSLNFDLKLVDLVLTTWVAERNDVKIYLLKMYAKKIDDNHVCNKIKLQNMSTKVATENIIHLDTNPSQQY